MTETLNMVKTYELPVTCRTLAPAEAWNQTIDNLNLLCQIMEETMMTITQRCQQERGKVHEITQRVAKCQKQARIIAQQPDKATVVYSCDRYEEAIKKRDNHGKKQEQEQEQGEESHYKPLVCMTNQSIGPKRGKYKLSIKQRMEQPKYQDTVQLLNSITQKTSQQVVNNPVGLGECPQWITSVSDCLLFNDKKNPYVKYELHDTLKGKETEKKSEEQKPSPMQVQPPTIQKRKTSRKHAHDIRYKPQIDKIFKLPTEAQLTMPGLSGVADVSYPMDMPQQRIAPSAVEFEALPDLTAFAQVTFEDDSVPSASSQSVIPSTSSSPSLLLNKKSQQPQLQLQQSQSQPQPQPQLQSQPQPEIKTQQQLQLKSQSQAKSQSLSQESGSSESVVASTKINVQASQESNPVGCVILTTTIPQPRPKMPGMKAVFSEIVNQSKKLRSIPKKENTQEHAGATNDTRGTQFPLNLLPSNMQEVMNESNENRLKDEMERRRLFMEDSEDEESEEVSL